MEGPTLNLDFVSCLKCIQFIYFQATQRNISNFIIFICYFIKISSHANDFGGLHEDFIETLTKFKKDKELDNVLAKV